LSMDEAHECVAKTSPEKLEKLTSDKSGEVAASIADDCRKAAEEKRGIKPENDVKGLNAMKMGSKSLDAAFEQVEPPKAPGPKLNAPSP